MDASCDNPNLEEQEMESEALQAIFPDTFNMISSTEWSLDLFPIDAAEDDAESDNVNHVSIKLCISLPPTYPDATVPELSIKPMKGLGKDDIKMLAEMATNEAESNLGMPCVFAVCEILREWLVDHNVKGQDDESMYAVMMRKQKEEKRAQELSDRQFESQVTTNDMSTAELEEIAVRKRRAEGTPVTDESFYAWKEKIDAEMAEKRREEEDAAKRAGLSGRQKKGLAQKISADDAVIDERMTGFQIFSGKGGVSAEAIEAAAADAEEGGIGDTMIADDVDENLFMSDDDLDDDDLDFDDDDDELDNSDIDEVDI